MTSYVTSNHSGTQIIPAYDGSRKKNAYRDWKKVVLAYQYGFGIAEEQLAPRVYVRRDGEAKVAVDYLDIVTDLAVEDGMRTLLKVLDKEFERETYDAVEDAVELFWTCRRSAGQTMESYIMQMRTARLHMKQNDPDTAISEQAYAVRLLRKAGLTTAER